MIIIYFQQSYVARMIFIIIDFGDFVKIMLGSCDV